MPRTARVGLPGQVYHVISRGNNRAWVFQKEEDFRKFFEIVCRYKKKYGFRLYHWVLMNNHFHFLLETPPQCSVSKIMQGINLAYAVWFNRKYSQVGHLWQDRFKSFLVQKNSRYLLACGRYIEKNPLRAGLRNTLVSIRGAVSMSMLAGKTTASPLAIQSFRVSLVPVNLTISLCARVRIGKSRNSEKIGLAGLSVKRGFVTRS